MQNHTIISISPACIFPGPSSCNSFTKSYPSPCTGSAVGRLLRRRLWQLLCPARASPCSAVIFKESSEGNHAQGRVISMGHGTMSGCNPTASQQQIPIYLQIRYPAGAICLSVVTYHPASAGRACSVSSALGPPFHTLRCGRAVAWRRAATCRTVNGWPSVRMGRCPPARHPTLLGLPRPPEPPQTQGRQVLSASWKDQLRTHCFTNSKIIVTYVHAHTYHTS